MGDKPFILEFEHDFTKKDDIIFTRVNDVATRLRVLENPHRKWYKIVLQILCIGFYQAPYEYKVKIV